MLRTTNLAFRYEEDSPLLTFPDVECPALGQLLLLGESGCGKTTLLHLLCGMLQPAQGTVQINGQALDRMNEAERDAFRGQNVGIVFQKSHFLQSLTVLENLAMPAFLNGATLDKHEGIHMLEQLGIAHKAHSRPRDLSTGEQQRAGIARALIHRPSLVLADEPTSALDDGSTEAVIGLLEAQVSAAGATLVIVTHDQRLKDRFENRLVLTAQYPSV
ncbi:MAG: ABC transporter ATP-binding protein [Crocinitomicaceae bacterium]|nr:ABC transporter ATP-binding protein [Crocinitomicaceae bacterium]